VPFKNKRQFKLPLPGLLVKELQVHVYMYAPEDGWLFMSAIGGPLRHQIYRRVYRPALKESGLAPDGCLCDRKSCDRRYAPLYRFHDLRHSAASIAASRLYAGESAKVVQRTSHSTQQVTTEIHTHLFPEELERWADSVDRIHVEAEESVSG
jgi:integrase